MFKEKNIEDSANPVARLNKAIAQSGFCARRKADALIFAGRVKVNGRTEKNPGRKVFSGDLLEVDGKVLAKTDKKIYVMMNKPPAIVCTVSDPQSRETILDILPPELKKYRLYPVGRLDFFSEGLLLLTNDGQFAQKMAHPSFHQSKEYEALIRGPVEKSAINIMRSGMTLDDGKKLLPVEARARLLKNGDTLLNMTLRQGINRQIRKMCASFGLVILRLKRIRQGALLLGDLPRGACRMLSAEELAQAARKDV